MDSSQETQYPDGIDVETPQTNQESSVGSLGVRCLNISRQEGITFSDRVRGGKFAVKIEDWKLLKEDISRISVNFVPEATSMDYACQLEEIFSTFEDEVMKNIVVQDRKMGEGRVRRSDNLLKLLEESIEENFSVIKDVEKPSGREEILKKIGFLSRKLITKRSVQLAYQIGVQMENVRPLFKNKKEYMSNLKYTTTWSAGYITFILGLTNFVREYPRLLYTTLSIFKLKAEFKKIKELFIDMEDDKKQVWKMNPGNFLI